MKQAAPSRKIHVWFRLARRLSRNVRKLSLTLLSIAIIAGRVVEMATKLGGGDGC